MTRIDGPRYTIILYINLEVATGSYLRVPSGATVNYNAKLGDYSLKQTKTDFLLSAVSRFRPTGFELTHFVSSKFVCLYNDRWF